MSTSGISFSGLFSGLDTDNIIEQLIYIEEEPIRLLEDKKIMFDYEREALQEVNTSMLSLQDLIQDFKDGLLLENKASSSDEDVLTATANAGAAPGTYDINIINLATAHRVASDAQAGNYAGANGSFEITVGGETFSVAVNTGDSMAAISQRINSAISGGGKDFTDYGQASIITNPGAGEVTLIIESLDTGAGNALSFNDVPDDILTSLGILDGLDAIKNELQAAQDAALTINGVAITSDSNTIDSAIYGVTMTLQENFGNATLTVGLDVDEIVSKVVAFVEQFNTTTDLLHDYINEESVEDPTTEAELKQGVLQGDWDLASAKSEIRMKTTGYVDNTLSVYKILAQIGITSEATVGTLVSDNIEVDEDKLRAALNDDKEEVAALLQGFADQMDDYLESQTKVSTVDTLAGNFYRRILSIDDRQDNIDEDIATWEDRIAAIEDRYRTQFSAMETYLSTLQSQSEYLTSQLSNLSSS
jgi:flagellar hook-associated protein 2